MAGESGGRNGTAFNAEDAEDAEGSGGKKVQNAECKTNDGRSAVCRSLGTLNFELGTAVERRVKMRNRDAVDAGGYGCPRNSADL